jgi:hypothetical protein
MCLSLSIQKVSSSFLQTCISAPAKNLTFELFEPKQIQLIIAEDNCAGTRNENLTTFSCGPCSVVNRRPKNTRLDLVVNSLLRTHNQEEERRRNKTKKDNRKTRERES